MGGFSFQAGLARMLPWRKFWSSHLALPESLLTSANGRTWLTTNELVESKLGPVTPARVGDRGQVDVEPPPSRASALSTGDWEALVQRGVDEIRSADSGVEKVVLARQIPLELDRPAEVGKALRYLCEAYPECYVFAFGQPGLCFLGASPERLVKLERGIVSAGSLAGSAARGRTFEEDQALGRAMLASDKERNEHDLVTRGLMEDLQAAGVEVIGGSGLPTVTKVRNVQHLVTRIEGRAPSSLTVLDLAGRLHPTPAVGGYPREAALRAIARLEDFERGWYAGPVGWADRHGEGEFAVAIRSALVQGSRAWLYAGCGIVADSDPEREFAESELKLRPMREALAGD